MAEETTALIRTANQRGWYAIGPGSSTSTLPSAPLTTPRIAVSWRNPVPSERMVKI